MHAVFAQEQLVETFESLLESSQSLLQHGPQRLRSVTAAAVQQLQHIQAAVPYAQQAVTTATVAEATVHN
eukprot:14609-Heterococcus_DN1.PRE.2